MRSWPALPALLLVFCSPIIAASKEQRARGAALFASSGCQHCHMMNGVGGHRGPNLSNVGRTATKAAIRKQIIHGSETQLSDVCHQGLVPRNALSRQFGTELLDFLEERLNGTEWEPDHRAVRRAIRPRHHAEQPCT